MNLSKSYEFFQPEHDDARVHIVGCGSVGSTIAENLVRCGVQNITLWDFDTVEPHNMANQMFRQQDVGRLKVEALYDILFDINPDIKGHVKLEPKGWHGKNMSGYIILAVDSIDIRRQIVEQHMNNMFVKAVFDVRTGLTDAQHFAADWSDQKQKDSLLNSMQFTHEESEVTVSACGVTLGVVTTVRLISAICVNNYIKFTKGEGNWKFCQIDGFAGILDCF